MNYPTRPVDTSTDIEGTTSLQPSQSASSGNAVAGNMAGAHIVANRSMPRPLHIGNMQRIQAPGMTGYNLNPSAMGGGMNPSGIPMQRGVANQAQQQQLSRRKDPGMGMAGYPPQQKSRRF